MPPQPEDTLSSLEKARERLYQPEPEVPEREPLAAATRGAVPHTWKENPLMRYAAQPPQHHIRLAGIFFGVSVVFFIVALVLTGFFFFFGGNTVSANKIALDIQGPTTIAGGDTVPLSITIT